MNIANLGVRTTAGETFTGEETAKLAALILKRFGNDVPAATAAWRRLLQNSTPESDFAALAEEGARLG